MYTSNLDIPGFLTGIARIALVAEKIKGQQMAFL